MQNNRNKQNSNRKDAAAKGSVLCVTIEDLGQDGEGIGHADGCTYFIKDALIGDTVRASVMKAKKNYAYAHLDEILTPSKDRVEPRCPIARQCGGCQIQALDYEAQKKFKYGKVRNDLIRIGGFPADKIDDVMQEIVGMDDPWHYRNKQQLPVGVKDGKPVAGFYAGRTHSIIPVDECAIGAVGNGAIVKAVLSYMEECHVSAYDEATGKGLVRHVLIRTGFHSGEVMVCLVVNGKVLPKEEVLVERLKALPGITSIVLNTNTARTNVILGNQVRTLWGKEEITDSLEVMEVTKEGKSWHFAPLPEKPVTYAISALSFYQVNPVQTQKIYSLALAAAGLTGKETVWDLYCGVGTISLFLARHAGKVFGVEVIPQAIENARRNAKANGIENAAFEVGKVEDVLPEYVKTHDEPVDVVVVDPPRKGCDGKCLATILKVQPKRIVYVSCDPATLARDLKILCADGLYELKSLTPVDMFPHSVHVETVCLLSNTQRPKKESYITLDVEMEDYYRIKNEGKNSTT